MDAYEKGPGPVSAAASLASSGPGSISRTLQIQRDAVCETPRTQRRQYQLRRPWEGRIDGLVIEALYDRNQSFLTSAFLGSLLHAMLFKKVSRNSVFILGAENTLERRHGHSQDVICAFDWSLLLSLDRPILGNKRLQPLVAPIGPSPALFFRGVIHYDST